MAKKSRRAPAPVRDAQRNRPPDRTSRNPRPGIGRQRTLMAAMVGLIAVVCYANTFSSGFVLDDIRAIVENPLIRDLSNVGAVFRTNYWGAGDPGVTGLDPGLYRPLTVLTYLVSYQIWGLEPAAYHVLNVLLHAVASVLVFVVARDVLGSPKVAFAVGAVFAAHPIHTDAVSSVVGRAEVLATIFFLLAFWFARREPETSPDPTQSRWRASPIATAAIVAGFYFLALLAKESAVTLPAVLLLDDWLHREDLRRGSSSMMRSLILRYAPLVVVLVVYLVLRSQAVAAHGVWLGFNNVSVGQRLLTASRVLLEYLGLFLFPRTLLADYWTTDVPIARSIFEPLVLLSIVLWISIAAVSLTKLRRDRVFLFSTLWFFITILPVSNIFLTIGVAKAERILYLPSIGLCLLVGWGFLRIARVTSRQWMPAVALGIVIAALGLRTLRRNMDWKDNLALAIASLQSSPRSPLMNTMAAREYANRGDLDRAIRHAQSAARETPDVPQVHLQLAKLYLDRGMTERSVPEYRQVLRLDPNNIEAHNNLGVIYMRSQRLDSAAVHFQFSQRTNPTRAEPHINLGIVYSSLDRLSDAETELLAAIRLAPTNADAHTNLGTVYLKQKRHDDALAQFKAAVDLNPRNPEAHNNLGYVYLEQGRTEEAIAQFRSALELRPGYGNARSNLNRALRQHSLRP